MPSLEQDSYLTGQSHCAGVVHLNFTPVDPSRPRCQFTSPPKDQRRAKPNESPSTPEIHPHPRSLCTPTRLPPESFFSFLSHPQEDIRLPLNTFTSHSQYFLPISRAIHRSQHSFNLNGFPIHDLDLPLFLNTHISQINNSNNNIFNNNIIYEPFRKCVAQLFPL